VERVSRLFFFEQKFTNKYQEFRDWNHLSKINANELETCDVLACSEEAKMRILMNRISIIAFDTTGDWPNKRNILMQRLTAFSTAIVVFRWQTKMF
jgi:hypothetical protein